MFIRREKFMQSISFFQATRNFFISFFIFLIIDMVWLLFIGKNMYQNKLGDLMSSKVQLIPAFLFYLIFIVGLQFFVLYPALQKESIGYVLLAGMLYGLVTYATYDLTNLATLKNWPIMITVIDLIWGSFVSTATGLLSYLLLKKWF